MRKLAAQVILVILVIGLVPFIHASVPDIQEESTQEINPDILPDLNANSFILNQGQLDHPNIQFYTQGNFRAGFCSNSVVYAIGSVDIYSFKVNFIGCNNVAPEGRFKLNTYNNYFLGNDPENWHSYVPLYEEVYFSEIYTGIDLRYYSKNGSLKYDFIVHPGADPSVIEMQFEGVDSLHVDDSGQLLVNTPAGTYSDSGLVGVQGKNEVEVKFLADGNSIWFGVGNYDPDQVLIIDPEVLFSSYIGSPGYDSGSIIDVDCEGNLFVAGQTTHAEFPTTTGSYSPNHNGDRDTFLMKTSPEYEIIFSTYIGGNGREEVDGIFIDSNGYPYITGKTASLSNYPTTAGAYDTTSNSLNDGFITKVSKDGASLNYSTYIGGDDSDGGEDIFVNKDGEAYVVGYTASTDFPTVNANDNSFNGFIDGFLLKISSDGKDLLYSTFIGGSDRDELNEIFVDSSGFLYVAGETESNDIVLAGNSNDTTYNGNYDICIYKFSTDGSNILYSTYLGGQEDEWCSKIYADEDGKIYACGSTMSSEFVNTTGANDTTFNGNKDGFLLRYSTDGSNIEVSTFIGGKENDSAGKFKILDNGTIIISGTTESQELGVTQDALNDTHHGDFDIYFRVYNQDISEYKYSTFYGGSDFDGGGDFVSNDYGTIYCAMSTRSTDFPVTNNAWNKTFNGDYDCAVAKVRFFKEPPPFGPKITGIITGDSFINLTWTPPEDNGGLSISHYSIYRSTTSGTKTKLIDTVDSRTWFNDTGVTNGIKYFYNLSAVNIMGEGRLSKEVNGTPSTVSSEPLNPTKEMGPGYINVSWEEPANDGGGSISGYHIFRGTSSEALSLTYMDIQTLWLNDTGRTNGVTYYYRIGALNERGLGALSAEINDTTFAKPSAPYFLSGEGGDSYLNLSWSAPVSDGGDPLLTYDVYRGDTNTTMVEVASDLEVLYFNNTGLVNGQTYFFSVRAMNHIGYSPFSDEFNSTPASIPSPPIDLIAMPGDGYVQLNWTVPMSDGGDPISSYKIYRGEASDTIPFLAQTTELGYNDTSVENDKTYYYVVQALNLIGPSAFSNEVNATPSEHPFNVVPETTLTSPANNTDLDILNPTLTWTATDANGDNITYEVYVGEVKDDVQSHNLVNIIAAGISTTSFTWTTDLEAGKTYYWTVVPNDGIGDGVCLSGVWTFKVKDDAVANALPKFISTPPKDAGVDKKWSYTPLVTDADGDDITLTLNKNPTGMTMSSGKLTWTPTSSQLGEHDVILKASDGKGASFQEFTITVTTDGPANRAPEVQAVADITINVTDSLSVQVVASDPDGDELSYTLTDSPAGAVVSQSGKVIWNPGETGTFDFEIEVSDGELSTSISFKVTVKSGSDDDIVPDDDVVPDDDDDDTGFIGSIAFLALIGAIVLIILIVVGILVFVMLRKKKTPDELETSPEQTPEQTIGPEQPPDQTIGPQTTQDEYQDTDTDPFAQLAVQDAQANPVSQDMYAQQEASIAHLENREANLNEMGTLEKSQLQDLYAQPQEPPVQEMPPVEEPMADQPFDPMAEQPPIDQPAEQYPEMEQPADPVVEQNSSVEPEQDELFDI